MSPCLLKLSSIYVNAWCSNYFQQIPTFISKEDSAFVWIIQIADESLISNQQAFIASKLNQHFHCQCHAASMAQWLHSYQCTFFISTTTTARKKYFYFLFYTTRFEPLT